jgi:hypothetical protein
VVRPTLREPITILMPCRDQARTFFDAALRSVVQ